MSVKYLNWLGYTPLHGAAERGKKAAVQCLMLHGANIHEKTNGGKNIIYFYLLLYLSI